MSSSIFSTAFGHFAENSLANASIAHSARFLSSASVISLIAAFARGWTLFGIESSVFMVLWTQSRCTRVCGKTSLIAAQKPSAPSPTANSGALMPRFFEIPQQFGPALGGFPVAVG